MKKLFALLTILVMALALAACGGGGDTPSNSEGDTGDTPSSSSQQGGTGVGGGGEYDGHPILSDYASLTDAGDFDMFKRFGLDQSTVIPEETLGITRYLEDAFDDPFVRTEYGFELSAEPANDLVLDYARAIYEATKALSDDGEIYVWYPGDIMDSEDDGYMKAESYGDVRANAMFVTLQSWHYKYEGRDWTVTVSTEESAAPYLHWELQLNISTALSGLSPIVEGEHTPEPTPFVDSYQTETDVIGKSIPNERLVVQENLVAPGADYNLYAARTYQAFIYGEDGKQSEQYSYYFYDDEASYEKGLAKNLEDDIWGNPPTIASKMSLYIVEGGPTLFGSSYDTYEAQHNNLSTRGGAYTIIE